MKDLSRTISSFFSAYSDGRPVLVALSGGSDSMALFYLLLDLGISFHVAHVDHGWREESCHEAEKLRILAQQEGLPFHFHRIALLDPQKNLESSAREERLRFFEKICQKYDLQAVLTAHHADDQAETVMARFVTQAPLEKFVGIAPLAHIGHLTLWRPLLTHYKRELIAFLQERNITYFEDGTNRDLRRTRACFRHQLLPTMTEMTGRDAVASILSLKTQIKETVDFLELFIAPYLSMAKKGALGWKWKVDSHLLQWGIPLKFAIRAFFAKAEFPYHREIGEQIAVALQQGLANRVFESCSKEVIVDRGVLMIPGGHWNQSPPSWSFTIESVEAQEKGSSSSWEELWEGRFHAYLPVDGIQLIPVDSKALYPGHHAIRHWWNKNKVPAFMRTLVPLVVDSHGKVIHEFLTGKVTATGEKWTKVEGFLKND